MTNVAGGMLEGLRVLVTGGSRGIGECIVRTLVREGARVVVHYNSGRREAEGLVAELGEAAVSVQADLSETGVGNALWDKASEFWGGLDVLVNNAGAWIASPVENVEGWASGWDRNLSLNLLSAADLCRAGLVHFMATGGGVIVNITSRSAHRGDDAEHLAYGAAKAGLLSLTKGIARGYGHAGVCAYALAPGWVDTGLAAGAVDEKTLSALPLGEVTPPSDVAETVAFLASGRARHVTGATIDITGADYVR
ncbi:SDR family NAD(P)-dependent oxidoreductase [Corynebacterium glyciniphilum]|uniref:SDR family NAD(P)-dependent oxidoreductase n=1 Tax=Corynebacterium glyciniphilum TaxID=1404244 RepID=UPI0011AB300D|nr:SDR family oxidoreductase [Corynebacterium glyciniphilum]